MEKIVILVVDDNFVNRFLPRFILKPWSPQVEVFDCGSGGEAIDFIESTHITHMFLDISMPRLDGIQVARAIKEKSKFSNISIVAYTADVAMTEAPYFKSLGFDDVLLKPVDRLSLLKVIGL